MNKDYYSQFGLDGHEGIDYAGKPNEPILACAAGRVKMVHYLSNGWHNYGNHVRVTHQHGNDVYETIYAHLNAINVKVGDYVRRGYTVGLMGSTGNSTGTHLHLTLKKNGTIVNPAPYFGG